MQSTENPKPNAEVPLDLCVPSILLDDSALSDVLENQNDDFLHAVAALVLKQLELLDVFAASITNRVQQSMERRESTEQCLHGLRDRNVAGDLAPADTISLAAVERSGGLSFTDGNLIVHAGSLTFRVYREMIARQSPVLAGLLAPQKLSTYPIFEGCRVLQVPHSGTDATHFLAAIFNPNSFDAFFTRISFDAIAAVFRLSLTYRMPSLQRKALTYLSSVYPTTLVEFASAGLDPSYCRDQILPVIHFARAHSLHWILPLAFYRYCLEMTWHTQVHGVEYGGASVVLSYTDQELCHNAERTMRETHTAAMLERYFKRGGECLGGAECRKSRMDEGAVLLVGLRSMPDVIAWEPQPESRLCAACLEDWQRWHAKQLQSFWDHLQGLFDLPDWTVLNDQKDAALHEVEDEEEEDAEEDVTF
ncbi:hypothetical protein B0H19DRAFT_1256365 [Mycena capillaripes]|nr:hypothetical protein B0H19DRAFT_1256365 [Mycena capillaripes]